MGTTRTVLHKAAGPLTSIGSLESLLIDRRFCAMDYRTSHDHRGEMDSLMA